jgi:hypothetical protein
MPTTVVEFDERIYESPGYGPRLRRPVFLEGLASPRTFWGRRTPTSRPPPSKSAAVWGRMMSMHGLGASPCPAGYTFRQTGGRCFCDAELQGLAGLGEEIPCPRASVVAQERSAYTVYRAPKAETIPVPDDSPELVVTNDEGASVEPDLQPQEGPVIPVHKQTPPWVWYAGAGGGSLVIFWLLFRRKRKG